MMKVNDHFYKRRVEKYTPKQKEISKELYKIWYPETVFDAGCGIGGYLEGFLDCGCFISGCELGHDIAKEYMRPAVGRATFAFDLSKPLSLYLKYDLVVSVEVAEHIDEKYADTYVKSLTLLSKHGILFTAAGVGQRGRHHVNCQHSSYWIKKFEEHNVIFDPQETAQAQKCIRKLGDPFGICKNLMVFNV